MAVHLLCKKENREAYQQKLTHCLSEQPHDPNMSAEHNWAKLRDCLVSAGEVTIGRGRSKQPDWFSKVGDILQPLIDAKNTAHKHFIQSKALSSNSSKEGCRSGKGGVDL